VPFDEQAMNQKKRTKEHGMLFSLRVPQKLTIALKLKAKITNMPKISYHLWGRLL